MEKTYMRTYPELSDWHLHSHFSSDSTETPENIIKNAINMQLKSICFTEHNDYDYPLEDGNVVFALDYDKYTDELLELKERYKNDIFIGIGVEQGLLSSAKDKINNYDPTGRLDFIIGSSHLVYGNDPYYPEFWDNVSVKDAISRYYEAITDCIKTCDNFDVYGHLDYIVRYARKIKGIRHSAGHLHFKTRYCNLFISCYGYQNTETYSICVVEKWEKSCRIYPPHILSNHIVYQDVI